MSDFNYNVPTIVDFEHDVQNVDSYFDQINENIVQLKINDDEEEKFYSPIPFELPPNNKEKTHLTKPKSFRRSLSAGDLKTPINRTNLKRSTSKDGGLNPKKTNDSSKVQQKFISMAEAINRFHRVTPLRFHTKVKVHPKPVPCKLTSTIPQSPALNTKMRHRTNNVLSSTEREIQEFNEQQKFKIKAHPVNYKVLKGPMKVDVNKPKSTTKPEPFKLTKTVKTEKQPETEPQHEFHATSVPKSVYVPPKTVKLPHVCTKPVTPTFMKNMRPPSKMRKANSDLSVDKKSSIQLHQTKVEPFTFEHKYDMAKKKKEELIKKVLEEEKKAREFHARPMPKLFQRTRTLSAGSSHKSEDDVREVQFKARPATILYKEPFIPKKSDRPLVEVTDVHLNTDKRAQVREEFNRHLREREEQIELIKKQHEYARQLEEMKEIQRLRKEAEHVAQPIRKYKEVKKLPPNKLTQPISPKFLSGRHRNKENQQGN